MIPVSRPAERPAISEKPGDADTIGMAQKHGHEAIRKITIPFQIIAIQNCQKKTFCVAEGFFVYK